MNDLRKTVVLRYLLDALKRTNGAYGYDIWLPGNVTEQSLLWQCAIEVLKAEPPPAYTPPVGMGRVRTFGEESGEIKLGKELFPLASDILWLLSVRGIVRPGVRIAGGQTIDQGQGYSLTLKGREWIQAYSEEELQELCVSL